MTPGSVHEKDITSPWRAIMSLHRPIQLLIFSKNIDYVELDIIDIMFGKLLCRVEG